MKRVRSLLILCSVLFGAACSNDSELFNQVSLSQQGDTQTESTATRSYKNEVSIQIETPGTLKEQLGDKLTTTDKLVLSGAMDADDASTFLNEMTALVALDLTDATFVETEKTFCNNAYRSSVKLSLIEHEITNHMFYNKQDLVEITLPKGVTNINEYAFYNCSALADITLPESLETIGNYSIMGCSSLATLEIPKRLVSVGEYAFRNCKSLTNLSFPEGFQTIGQYAFYGCRTLTEVSLPESLITIEKSAFYDCRGITRIDLPQNLENLEPYAFHDCTGLIEITIPNSIMELSDHCFYNCSALETVVLPDNLTVIGDGAFWGTHKLQSINLPQTLKVIGNSAFYGCWILNFDSQLPESIEMIGERAFADMGKLATLVFPSKITSIPQDVCSGCISLQSVSLPENCTSIAQNAFKECKSLSSITIPKSCISIGSSAFNGCTSLDEITIFPNSALSFIGNWAFANTAITHFDFSNTALETIENSAFYNSKVGGILTFPPTLKSIGDGTFQGNPVTAIYLTGTGEVSLGNIFGNVSNCLIYTQSETTSTHANIPNVIAQYNDNYCISLQLVENDSFHCPEAFTAGKVTFTKSFNRSYWGSTSTAEKGKASNWYGISLPFTVETITTKDGRTFAPFNAGVEGAKPFWLRKLTIDDTFTNVTSIQAGEPYIIAFPNYAAYLPEYNVTGDVTFSTKGRISIPVTEEYAVNGSAYSMRRSYEIRPQSAAIYLLNSPRGDNPVMGENTNGWGSVFLPSLRDSWAFEAYVAAPWNNGGTGGGEDSSEGFEGIPIASLPSLQINASASTRSMHEIGSIPSIDDM